MFEKKVTRKDLKYLVDEIARLASRVEQLETDNLIRIEKEPKNEQA
jgi:hypothetical protein